MPDSATASVPQSGASWVDSLTDFLSREQNVEAILLDQATHRVSLATLGEVDLERLHQKLNAVLRTLDESHLNEPPSKAAGYTIRRLPNETLIEKPSCPTAPLFWKWREFAWPEPEEIEEESRAEWQGLALQAGICGIALGAAWSLGRLEGLPLWISLVFYGVSIVAGAWDAAQDAWGKIRQGQLDVHFLMLAVAMGAVAIGAWAEGALLLFLFSLSGALEHYALHRTHREINALTKAAPKTATVIGPDGRTTERAVTLLEIDDLVQVKPDQLFPVDGEILDGRTAADESNLTGEATPVSKEPGETVFSGTLNLWGAVKVRVTRPAAESALQRIVNLIQTAQHLRAPSQRFTDRFGTGYTYGILGLVAVMFLVWWLVFKIPPFQAPDGQLSAFYRAMTLLVVASPCALVLSIPSAILAAIAWAARKGILFRGGAAIEKLAEIDTVALDKTGTLTTGELRVDRVESFPPGHERRIAEIACTLEANSNHPIARAITAYGKKEGLQMQTLDEFQSLTGKGLRGKVDDQVCYLGRRELLDAGDLSPFLKDLPEPPMELTEVWVVHEKLIGRILLKDQIRQESRAVLRELERRNVRTLMLTGDRRGAAERIAQELGVSEVRAGLHPEDKVAAIQELTEQGHKVAMVGDGVNDAPSLAAAYVSVAMGGRGSDAALEQSDLVLMKDKIEKLLSAIRISAKARAVIKQNLAISLGTIGVMMVLALFFGVHLTEGVLAHEGSTVLVCLNSLRLLFVGEETGQTPAGGGGS